MSLPEGWEWLDDIPDWSPPSELEEPTKVHSTNLVIQMLSSESLGNALIDLVGQFLSEKARFNMWFAQEAKRKASSPKELALLGYVYVDQTRRVYEAWAEFINASYVNDRMAGTSDAEGALLTVALGGAVAKLRETRGHFEPTE